MTLSLLGLAAACGMAALSPTGPSPTGVLPGTLSRGGSLELSIQVQRDWSIELPAEQFLPVSGALPLPGTETTYATELDGKNLRVDTDGDGTTDVRIEGEDGVVVLRGAASDGTELSQAWRLKNTPKGWQFASACTRSGKLGKTKIRLVDQDADGRYDGYGKDAMIVGRGDVACFLSRVVNVAGELYTIEVAADGTSIDYAPYTGPSGTLDLSTELDTDGKLLAMVVRSNDGRYSFDLAKARSGMLVPSATYALHNGRIGLGEATVEVKSGRAKPITVAADAKVAPVWGGPVDAEFSYERSGAQLAISPDQVHYYGTLGEEYTDWAPRGSSPEFLVKERKLGTELTKAMFPGSC